MAGAGKAVRGRAASADGCVLDQMAVTICCWSLSHPVAFSRLSSNSVSAAKA